MTEIRIFTREQLDTWGLPDDLPTEEHATKFPEAPVELHREQVDSRRWVSVHELIFRAPDDGLTYQVFYEQGLTENQDDTDPWNFDDAIKATEVEQRPVVVQQWTPVDAPADRSLDELLPAWEAMYEPGNVSDYLIGYANSEAGAKGAAEAWLRSEKDEVGRLEWVSQKPPNGYDTEFELVERYGDRVDIVGPGITVRRRTSPTP
ncbi:hypothetical protein [Streptomyces sp. NPDC056723]|uniref:hypothetical protein n=1 Tax=Streptomyces sp. NPDC056723 TaxID=3345925 RepID=UPI003693414F